MHEIKVVSENAAIASSFQTLIIVQPKENELARPVVPELAANAYVSGDFYRFQPALSCCSLIPRRTQPWMAVNISFDSIIIDAAQIQRILYQIEHLIQEVCRLAHNDPNTAIRADVKYLTQQDYDEVLAWNNHGISHEADNSCLYNAITQQAEQQPDAPAICVWDGQSRSEMSYRELHNLSTRTLVRQHGVRSETIVPICSENSIFAVVVILDVLQAGGAFMLLDPTHPQDRLVSVLGQTRAKMVIISENCARLFSHISELASL